MPTENKDNPLADSSQVDGRRARAELAAAEFGELYDSPDAIAWSARESAREETAAAASPSSEALQRQAAENLARARARMQSDPKYAAAKQRFEAARWGRAVKQQATIGELAARALAADEPIELTDEDRALDERIERIAADGCDQCLLADVRETTYEDGAPSSESPVVRSEPPHDRVSRDPSSAPALSALTRNPRKLRYHRTVMQRAWIALRDANRAAIAGRVERLIVPREVYDVCHAINDDMGAVAGALDWIRRTLGPAVALECEAGALYRVRGGVQRDDWASARARRKLSLLTAILMSPHTLPRASVCGGPRSHVRLVGSGQDEPLLVTAGVPQTLLVKLARSGQRESYSTRTLQRDLAEIDECTEMLMRWRVSVVHAAAWEHSGDHGVINRYCARVRMVREQWGRAASAAEAWLKQQCLSAASWMVWRPAPARGSPVPWKRGAVLAPS